MGLGAAALAIAVLAVLAWATYLFNQARVRRRREPAPQNLAPYMTDDELESKRIGKVLIAALVTTAILAIVMPIYFLDESSRQAEAGEHFEEIAVERGHELFLEFQCFNCHGADGGGGGADFVEPRSGVETSWAAPSLNDVFFRYTEEEVRYWIVFGRQGTPMPAWGIEGGGALNSQQIDELLAYLESIQVPQGEAVTAVDGRVSRALTRLATADETVEEAIASQQVRVDRLVEAPERYEAVRELPDGLAALLAGDGTCTERSAALLDQPCDSPGTDTDRDGLSDAAESALADLIDELVAQVPPSDSTRELEGLGTERDGTHVPFDPESAFTGQDGTRPVPDLEQAEIVVTEFETIVRDLRLTTENQDSLLAAAQAGLDFLIDAREEQRYSIDFDHVAGAGFDGNVADAQRAVALFNAYCARCHTAGYSAGLPYTREAGSGAFGPSLRQGKAEVQFPDPVDHLEFIINGSEDGVNYGANGIGRGWMPGFGTVLSQEDLMLIVAYERVMP